MSVGRLLASGYTARLPGCDTSGVVSDEKLARYSGGAAPVSHRFPCPALEINCLSHIACDFEKLSGRCRAGKRFRELALQQRATTLVHNLHIIRGRMLL